MAAEVVPVSLKTRKGTSVVDTDEEFSKVNFDKMKQLKTVFQKGMFNHFLRTACSDFCPQLLNTLSFF